jgi:hypothetical protein
METNNENDGLIPIPVSLLDLAQSFSSESERAAYLQGFSAALFSLFASTQADGAAIAREAASTGKAPNPLVVITLTLRMIQQFMKDIDACRRALEVSGNEGLKSMLKLLETPPATKVIQ